VFAAVGGRCRPRLLYRDRPHRAEDGPRPVKAGSGLALVFCPECPQRLWVKRDFACTFTWRFSPVLVALRSQLRLRLEGPGTDTQCAIPDLSAAKTFLTVRPS